METKLEIFSSHELKLVENKTKQVWALAAIENKKTRYLNRIFHSHDPFKADQLVKNNTNNSRLFPKGPLWSRN
jgi:hypothetical protein